MEVLESKTFIGKHLFNQYKQNIGWYNLNVGIVDFA